MRKEQAKSEIERRFSQHKQVKAKPASIDWRIRLRSARDRPSRLHRLSPTNPHPQRHKPQSQTPRPANNPEDHSLAFHRWKPRSGKARCRCQRRIYEAQHWLSNENRQGRSTLRSDYHCADSRNRNNRPVAGHRVRFLVFAAVGNPTANADLLSSRAGLP